VRDVSRNHKDYISRKVIRTCLAGDFPGRLFAFLVVFIALSALVHRAHAQGSSPCDPAASLPIKVLDIALDGTITLVDNQRLTLSGLLWPDHLEPKRREMLVKTLALALENQSLTWKALAPPDRWGRVPANLFVKEPGRDAPFWLQAGLAEAGLVPLWPGEIIGSCWQGLLEHEGIAIALRRGYWAPRAQAARLRRVQADPAAQFGLRLVARWRLHGVKPWRNLTFLQVSFLEVSPLARRGLSVSITQKAMRAITLARGDVIIARVVVEAGGLQRLRIETRDHIHRLHEGSVLP